MPASTFISGLLVLWVAKGGAEMPNIVHIVVDDLGWNYHPGGPNTESKTPNLDGLVADGLTLDRFYTHKICSPSRSALLSGRSPVFVNVENIVPEVYNPDDPSSGFQGVPPGMTLVSDLMSTAGYVSRFVGKWDIGMASMAHHPKNRGFDSWLGYWHHANDYWQLFTEACDINGSSSSASAASEKIRDLWRYNASSDGPAFSDANDPACSQATQTLEDGTSCTFEEALLASEASDIIRTHQGSAPLFLLYAMHLVHYPLQAPRSFVEAAADTMRSESIGFDLERLRMMAMVDAMDSFVGQVLAAVKEEKEVSSGGGGQQVVTWENTLLVVHSDNGGEIIFVGTCAGNNWPLRGGKFSNFEGGIRTFGVVGGGFLPLERRGVTDGSLFAIQDFYATYAALAGLSDWSTDESGNAAGLHPPDSINQLALILNGTSTSALVYPPRTELIIGDTSAATYNGEGATLVGGLLRWENDGRVFKLLLGAFNKGFLVDQDVVAGPHFPNRGNGTSDNDDPLKLRPQMHTRVCGRQVAQQVAAGLRLLGTEDAIGLDEHHLTNSGTCLFELTSNPTEDASRDLAASQPDRFSSMLARIDEIQASVFSPDRGSVDPRACSHAVSSNAGYWGPWL